jgi:ATP/maltotriose-dependent transcriptional regulator MalT
MARELEALEPEQLGAYAKAFVQCAHGELARLSGRFAEARMMMLEAIKRFRAMGIYTMAGGCYHFLCWTELQAGRPERALADLQGADALLAELGERGFRSTTQALLASVHMLLGERDAARRAVELAEQLAIRSDAMTYSIAHTVRADLALATGDASGAERWARSAVQFASGMDSPIPRGDAELALARVLHVEANPRAAMTHARTAL